MPKNQLVGLAAEWRRKLASVEAEAHAMRAELSALRRDIERFRNRERSWVDLAAEWQRQKLEGKMK